MCRVTDAIKILATGKTGNTGMIRVEIYCYTYFYYITNVQNISDKCRYFSMSLDCALNFISSDNLSHRKNSLLSSGFLMADCIHYCPLLVRSVVGPSFCVEFMR